MDREPNSEGGPDVDEFDAIVAVWRAEGQVPQWPAGPEPAAGDFVTQPVLDEPATHPHPVLPALAEEEYHFIPPEPPPLPRIGPPALVGAILLALGLVLVITPGWFGMSDIYGLPLGLISLAAGLGWLVLRLWPDSLSAPDRDNESDDGAIL